VIPTVSDFSRSKCAGNKAVFARLDVPVAQNQPKPAKTRPTSQRKERKEAKERKEYIYTHMGLTH
jgi:hypothetical protein